MSKSYAGNQSFLRDLNITTVLRKVRRHGIISRTELSNEMGLKPSTITSIVNYLISEGLLIESGVKIPKEGRPQKLLQFNHDTGYIVCINLEARDASFYVTDLGDRVLFEEHLPFRNIDSLLVLVRSVKEAVKQQPVRERGLVGIVIVCPGVIDNGSVGSFNLHWPKFPLKDYFSEHFDCPIIVDNDANACVWAEHNFGTAVSEPDCCYIRVGNAVSAGILTQGTIYRGKHGFAGRIGHMVIEANGRPCICGNRGCWEAYVSEESLERRYKELSGRENVTSVEVFQRVQDRDPHAITALHEYAEYLGIGISSVINLLNPGLIVIGGVFDDVQSIITGPLFSVLQQRVLPLVIPSTRISFSTLGRFGIVRGAVDLVLETIFSTPHIEV